MRSEGQALRGRAPSRASIGPVVLAALGTYRRRFWRIVGAAVIVFAPIDLAVTLATEIGRDVAENADVLSAILWVASTAVSVAGSTLGLVFFAGVIDRIVAVDQHGHDEAPLGDVLRGLPTTRLILAGLATTGLVLAGFLLLVVPGVVVMVLLCLVGPLIVIERLRVWEGLRRSAQLVWRHFLLATSVVLVPTLLEEELTAWIERLSWYESPIPHLAADVVLTIFVGGIVGVIEVTLAHALIADHRRRLAEMAAGDAAVPPPDDRAPAPALGAGPPAEAGQAAER